MSKEIRAPLERVAVHRCHPIIHNSKKINVVQMKLKEDVTLLDKSLSWEQLRRAYDPQFRFQLDIVSCIGNCRGFGQCLVAEPTPFFHLNFEIFDSIN